MKRIRLVLHACQHAITMHASGGGRAWASAKPCHEFWKPALTWAPLKTALNVYSSGNCFSAPTSKLSLRSVFCIATPGHWRSVSHIFMASCTRSPWHEEVHATDGLASMHANTLIAQHRSKVCFICMWGLRPHRYIRRRVKITAQRMHSHIKAGCTELVDDLACLAVYEALAVWADLQVCGRHAQCRTHWFRRGPMGMTLCLVAPCSSAGTLLLSSASLVPLRARIIALGRLLCMGRRVQRVAVASPAMSSRPDVEHSVWDIVRFIFLLSMSLHSDMHSDEGRAGP